MIRSGWKLFALLLALVLVAAACGNGDDEPEAEAPPEAVDEEPGDDASDDDEPMDDEDVAREGADLWIWADEDRATAMRPFAEEFGAQEGLEVRVTAISAVLVGFVIGGVLGLVSGYFRNWVGRALASLFDILLAIPALVLAISLVAVLKGQPGSNEGFQLPVMLVLVIAIGIVSIPLLARITRANTMTWSQRDFVTAARAQGAKDSRIIFREILPNVLPAMVYISLLGVAIAIVAEGGLALLGNSVEPPTATWGTMINTGRSDMDRAPFILFLPILVVFLTVLSFNYLSDVIRARFDVRESAL